MRRSNHFMDLSLCFALALWATTLCAQDPQWEAFSIGSYDNVTEEVTQVNSLWKVTDMDDGTCLVLTDGPNGMAVAKKNGIVFISYINLNRDNKSSMILIANLPITFGPNATVQFTCEKGKFIYLYNLARKP